MENEKVRHATIQEEDRLLKALVDNCYVEDRNEIYKTELAGAAGLPVKMVGGLLPYFHRRSLIVYEGERHSQYVLTLLGEAVRLHEAGGFSAQTEIMQVQMALLRAQLADLGDKGATPEKVDALTNTANTLWQLLSNLYPVVQHIL